MKPIFVVRPSLPPLEEYVGEIADIWETGIMTHQGPKHVRLQHELKDFMGAENVTLFANGHLALELGLEALGVTSGEVITTPFTFGSTTQAILRNGCTPVYCDIRGSDFTMDPDGIEGLITRRTAAILPVHVYGNVCDAEAIREVADRHGLPVVYDAAHAFGERRGGAPVARLGDASMFSFHATKVFNTVEGGCLTYGDGGLTERLEGLRQFGQVVGTDRTPYVGTNAKMTEAHAAMGICNLRHMGEYIQRRRAVAEAYRERLAGVPGVRLSAVDPDTEYNYAYFPVVFEESESGVGRDEAIAALADQGIHVRKYFWPLCCDFEAVRSLGVAADVPVARHVSDRVVTLPCYSDLPVEDAHRVCDVILGLLGR